MRSQRQSIRFEFSGRPLACSRMPWSPASWRSRCRASWARTSSLAGIVRFDVSYFTGAKASSLPCQVLSIVTARPIQSIRSTVSPAASETRRPRPAPSTTITAKSSGALSKSASTSSSVGTTTSPPVYRGSRTRVHGSRRILPSRCASRSVWRTKRQIVATDLGSSGVRPSSVTNACSSLVVSWPMVRLGRSALRPCRAPRPHSAQCCKRPDHAPCALASRRRAGPWRAPDRRTHRRHDRTRHRAPLARRPPSAGTRRSSAPRASRPVALANEDLPATLVLADARHQTVPFLAGRIRPILRAIRSR